MRSAGSRHILSPHKTINDSGMDSFEATTHPFIVRIWLEETAGASGQATWRGHITHVPSGERQYLESLDDIILFITPYLAGMGVKPGISWKIRQWAKQIKAGLIRNS